METLTKRPKLATEVRQAGLVDAALAMAAERSPADITTAELAQAVGITQGAVFRHFSSKESIWLAVIDWTTSILMARLQAAATTKTTETKARSDPLSALQSVFMAHVDFVIEYPGVPRIIFQELQHAQDSALKASVRTLMQSYRLLLTGLLQDAKKQKLLAEDTDISSAAVLFMGSVQGLVMQSMLSGQVQAMATQAQGVFAIYLRGITCKEFS
ncbi:MAG: TetR family transcriptional regulator [Burkholderiales bacterium]|nr:TetR family transcriptional regulator [Burkholderiales bacterium]